MIKTAAKIFFVVIGLTGTTTFSWNPFKFVFTNVSDNDLYVTVEHELKCWEIKEFFIPELKETILVPPASYLPLGIKNKIIVSVYNNESYENLINQFPLSPTTGDQATYGVALCKGDTTLDRYWFGFDPHFELSDNNIQDYLSKSGFTQKFNRIEL